MALLENAATNLRDKLLIRILFPFGCWVSQALGLTVEDVDFDGLWAGGDDHVGRQT